MNKNIYRNVAKGISAEIKSSISIMSSDESDLLFAMGNFFVK
jgi:hypothetical protein